MNVADAYAEALRTTRRAAGNFGWGIMLLPREKRNAVAALYAFARRVDDAADDPALASAERRRRLEALARDAAALPAAPGDDPVLVALADALVRFDVPTGTLADLVRGGLMDVERGRYATWEELREYCRCVAGSVGIACASIYGPSDRATAPPLAETLGVALQQINIMRDVPEDWRLGRVYLPQDELARFGVSEVDIMTGRVGPAWLALMEHQAARAETLLARGLQLLPLLDRRSALCVRTFAGVYRGLLVQMRARGYDVFTCRPQLSAVGKVRAVTGLRPSRDGMAEVK
ncbi:MAG TPA: phytoene/squalene synthase family protein [Gaiellaceae bacterium]|nr:phytoene/squalene synthase family protein [Gaiellaceae bacterium]